MAAAGLKAVLATVTLGLAALQVLPALWIYRKLPLAASPPRPVPPAPQGCGFRAVRSYLPNAVHCLIAYGVQLTSVRVAVHSPAGAFSTVRSSRRCCWCRPGSSRMGAAGSGRHTGGRRRRSLVHLGAVVLQQLPASAHLGCRLSAPLAAAFPGCGNGLATPGREETAGQPVGMPRAAAGPFSAATSRSPTRSVAANDRHKYTGAGEQEHR